MELSKFISFVCFMGLSLFAAGQKQLLHITIIDEKTEEPVSLATIFIKPCECGGVTDESGKLSISLMPGNIEISITSVGYGTADKTVDFRGEQTITYLLSSQNYILDDVVITGQNTRKNLTRSEMGVQQISGLQLKKLPTAIGEVDVFRGLAMMPGVGSAGEASNGISVRGGSLDQNLVLLDNAPIFNPTHLFGIFSVFTPEAISEVDLFKANVPARFGGRIASVLDIKVKNPNAEKLTLNGGIGFVSSKLAVEAPLIKNKLYVLAATRIAHNDFLFPLFNKLKKTKANFVDGTLKMRFKSGDNDNFYLTTFYSHDFYQLDISSKINSINASSNQYDYSTLNNTLRWLHNFENKSFLQTTLTVSDYKPKVLFPQAESSNIIEYQSRIQHKSLTTEYSKTSNNNLSSTIGIQGVQFIISPGNILPGGTEGIQAASLQNETSLEISGYADMEWTPNDALAFSAGLRYTSFFLFGPFAEATYSDINRNEIISIKNYGDGVLVKTYGGLEPRLGVRFKLTDNTSVKASYARTKQYIQNIYNSSTPLPTSRWKISERYIRPQSGSTYSLGIYQNFKQDKYAISLEGYYRDIDGVLDYKPGADFFLQEFIEQDIVQGIGQNYGVELNIEKPKGKLNGWLNYTWSRSLRKFNSSDIRSQINKNTWFASDFDRPHVFNGTFNVEANEYNTLSFNLTYQTGRPYSIANAYFTIDNVEMPIFLERNNARLPDYHRLDFSWIIHNITTNQTKRWKGDWVFTVYNLYGRKNALNRYYGSTQNGRLKEIFGGFPLGAYQLSIFSTPVVSLGYRFTWK